MESLRHILSPDFLLRNSVYTSVLIGFACPLVGVFLVLRRLVFIGVALPQIASTGIAIAFSVPMWLGLLQPEHAAHSEHLYAFAGSTFFSLGAILVMAFLERRGGGSLDGQAWNRIRGGGRVEHHHPFQESLRRSGLVGFDERRGDYH